MRISFCNEVHIPEQVDGLIAEVKRLVFGEEKMLARVAGALLEAEGCKNCNGINMSEIGNRQQGALRVALVA